MSIKKKLSIFVVVLLIIPMTFLLLSAQYFFDQQIEENEKIYLQAAIKTVLNDIDNRQQEMLKAGRLFAGNQDLSKAVSTGDRERIGKALQNLDRNFDYLDYVVIVDKNNKVLSASSPYLLYPDSSIIKILTGNAMQLRKTHISQEVVALGDLFAFDSLEYNKFLVKKLNQPHGAEQYLRQGLISVAVVPIHDQDDHRHIIGAMILGDLINNDTFFAESYSKSVNNSFLAFSVEGIRIASNIRTDTRNDFTGSSSPHNMSGFLEKENQYFGKVDVAKEVHVFLDKLLFNSADEPIAIVGIGIPEEKFLGIINNNYKYLFDIFLICLVIMLFLGRLLAERISQPIVYVTDMAKEYCENNFGSKAVLNRTKTDEGNMLLEMFEKFTSQLEQKKKENQLYLSELQCEHKHQKRLAEELKKNNEQLEMNVAERTRYLKDALNELKKVDVAKSQFMANISHELRTPLNAIIGSSEILKDNVLGTLNAKQEKYIENIYSSSKHLLQLINDILDISKIASGKMTLNYSEFYIKDVVLQMVEHVKSYAPDKKMQIVMEFEPEDFILQADAAKIKQILYNLLSNAVKFTGQGGEISIRVYKRDAVAEFIVLDTGIGIAEQDQQRVFVEFEQVDNSYTREYEGTGLGLPLVKKMVEMHGGYVYLKSVLGQGTEVIFTIPLTAAIEGTIS